MTAQPGARRRLDHGRVLDHVRVLDLTAWQAGPMVTMILADFGAEVLKIEAASRLDGWRGSAGMLEDRAYERSPIWLGINRNKLGLSLDLTTVAGRDIFLRLAADADVVVENFTPRVMANFGLSYDVLRAANERLVMISLSGFGASGPWRDYSAFAFPTEQVSGLTYLNGARGGPPLAIGQPAADALAGATGAFAVVAALLRRERTGVGEHLDLSQIEALTSLIGAELVGAQVNSRDPERRGNRRPGFEPHGVFPCLPPERWVAIAVRSDDEWARLCGVLDRPDLAADPALATVLGRSAATAAVHEAVCRWTRERAGDEVVAALQAVDIASSVVMRPSLLMGDEQLWARGFYWLLERDEVDPNFIPGSVVRLGSTPARLHRPAPLFGEHTRDVLGRLLGLGEAELDELEAAGVTATVPAPQTWR
jgi:crotonobetainyl-CoA:carnitine CoA-transferase CaiB-like acyl-CoA transferase